MRNFHSLEISSPLRHQPLCEQRTTRYRGISIEPQRNGPSKSPLGNETADWERTRLRWLGRTFLKFLCHELGHSIGFVRTYQTRYKFQKAWASMQKQETRVRLSTLRLLHGPYRRKHLHISSCDPYLLNPRTQSMPYGTHKPCRRRTVRAGVLQNSGPVLISWEKQASNLLVRVPGALKPTSTTRAFSRLFGWEIEFIERFALCLDMEWVFFLGQTVPNAWDELELESEGNLRLDLRWPCSYISHVDLGLDLDTRQARNRKVSFYSAWVWSSKQDADPLRILFFPSHTANHSI